MYSWIIIKKVILFEKKIILENSKKEHFTRTNVIIKNDSFVLIINDKKTSICCNVNDNSLNITKFKMGIPANYRIMFEIVESRSNEIEKWNEITENPFLYYRNEIQTTFFRILPVYFNHGNIR